MEFNKPWKQYEGKWVAWSGKVQNQSELYFKYIKYNSYDGEAIYWGWSEFSRMFKYLYLYPGPESNLKLFTPTYVQLRKVIIDAFKSKHDYE